MQSGNLNKPLGYEFLGQLCIFISDRVASNQLPSLCVVSIDHWILSTIDEDIYITMPTREFVMRSTYMHCLPLVIE